MSRSYRQFPHVSAHPTAAWRPQDSGLLLVVKFYWHTVTPNHWCLLLPPHNTEYCNRDHMAFKAKISTVWFFYRKSFPASGLVQQIVQRFRLHMPGNIQTWTEREELKDYRYVERGLSTSEEEGTAQATSKRPQRVWNLPEIVYQHSMHAHIAILTATMNCQFSLLTVTMVISCDNFERPDCSSCYSMISVFYRHQVLGNWEPTWKC